MSFYVIAMKSVCEVGNIEIHDPTQGRERLACVEGLRGLAMTLVFFGHFDGMFRSYVPAGSQTHYLLDYVSVFAHQGVLFFLLISGYFIYSQFLDKSPSYWRFVLKRLSRIYPTYLAVLAIYLVLSALFPSESRIPPDIGAAAVYVFQNVLLIARQPIITVSWTISALILLYITIPLLVMGARMSHWSAWARVAVVLVCFVAWVMVPRKDYPALEERVAIFWVGPLIYESVRTRIKLSARGEKVALFVLALSFTLWYLLDGGYLRFLPAFGSLSKLYRFAFMGAGMFYFGLYCFAYRGMIARFLSGRIFRWLGRISLAYYLFHGLTLKALKLVAKAWVPAALHSTALYCLGAAVACALTLMTSAALYGLIERYVWHGGIYRRAAALWAAREAPGHASGARA